MDQQISDDDIRTFLKVNRSRYASQIALMQAAMRLLWPHGAPTAAGLRLAKLVLQEANAPAQRQTRRGNAPFLGDRRRRGTAPLPGTSPLPGTGPLAQTSPLT
jgi:hypothetical protein